MNCRVRWVELEAREKRVRIYFSRYGNPQLGFVNSEGEGILIGTKARQILGGCMMPRRALMRKRRKPVSSGAAAAGW